MQQSPRDPRIELVLVGFSPASRLAPIARRLGWEGQVLGDEPRRLYRRLGLGRAPWWRVYTVPTIATYLRHLRDASGTPDTGEDTRQLGGDAVALAGRVTTLWRPRSPDDRPDAAAILAAAAAML